MAERNSMENYQYMIRCTFASDTHAIFEVKIYNVEAQDILNFLPCIYEENIIFRRGEGMVVERMSRSLGNTDIIPQSMMKEIDAKLYNFADFIFKIR